MAGSTPGDRGAVPGEFGGDALQPNSAPGGPPSQRELLTCWPDPFPLSLQVNPASNLWSGWLALSPDGLGPPGLTCLYEPLGIAELFKGLLFPSIMSCSGHIFLEARGSIMDIRCVQVKAYAKDANFLINRKSQNTLVNEAGRAHTCPCETRLGRAVGTLGDFCFS